METKPNPSRIASVVGVIVAGLFWLAFVSFLYAVPDPQNGIGLFFSPIYATWIGVSVKLILQGILSFRTADSSRRISGRGAILFIIVGVIGLGVITAFLGGEYYQATHPITIHRN